MRRRAIIACCLLLGWPAAARAEQALARFLHADALCGSLSRWLDAKTEGSDLFRARIVPEPDGSGWHLKFGLVGPGLRLTPRHLVLSWSPMAAGANVEFLQRRPDPPQKAGPDH